MTDNSSRISLSHDEIARLSRMSIDELHVEEGRTVYADRLAKKVITGEHPLSYHVTHHQECDLARFVCFSMTHTTLVKVCQTDRKHHTSYIISRLTMCN